MVPVTSRLAGGREYTDLYGYKVLHFTWSGMTLMLNIYT